MTIIPDNTNTVITCQHFGFVELVNPVENEIK